MNTHNNADISKRRGRPPNTAIDRIRVIVWFWYVALSLEGNETGYAIEKLYPSKRTKKNKNSKVYRTCKHDKFRRGEHVPETELVDKIEKDAPGSKALLEHPLWEVLNKPFDDIDRLYNILTNLKPEVSSLLFLEPTKKSHQEKIRFSPSLLNALNKQSDLDALIACIGLIQEAKYYGDSFQHNQTTAITFKIFLRVFTQFPYNFVAQDVFVYLRDNILHIDFDSELQDSLEDIKIEEYILPNSFILSLIEDLNIFNDDQSVPLTSLYFSDKLLTPSVFNKTYSLACQGKYKEITKQSEFKKFIQLLQRWKDKQLLTQPTIFSY